MIFCRSHGLRNFIGTPIYLNGTFNGGETMKLTKVERVSLIIQYKMLKKIDPDNAADYEEYIQILERGYEYFYPNAMQGIGGYEPIDKEETLFIYDLINMYRAFERVYDREGRLDEPYATFMGFDGNHEGKFISFMKFMIKDNEHHALAPYLDRSSIHAMPSYRAMVSAWNLLSSPYKHEELTIQDIQKILAARSNRT